MNPASSEEAARLAVVEAQVANLEERFVYARGIIERLDAAHQEMALSEREHRTNWRLAIAIGGLGGTILVALILFVAGAH